MTEDTRHHDANVSSALARILLRYVRRAMGEECVDEVVRRTGVDGAAALIVDDTQWMTPEQFDRFLTAAADVVGDAEIGRRLGEELFERDRFTPTGEFLRAAGDPAAALGLVVEGLARMSPSRHFSVVDGHDTELLVDSIATRPEGAHPVHCQSAKAYFAKVPGLFGVGATVAEPRCVLRGHDRCRFVIRWDHPVAMEDGIRDEHRRRADESVARFESIQSAAAEMAAVVTLDDAMVQILDRAVAAAPAAQWLLAVSADGTSPYRCRSRGLDPGEVDEILDAIAHDDGSLDDRAIVVEIETDERHFGHLVAFVPPSGSHAEDRRVLEAYAVHAAATIERVRRAEDAARDHRAARALLELANLLAGVMTLDQVADRLVEAVADVSGCEVTGVWITEDREDGTFVLRSSTQGPVPGVIRSRAPKVHQLDRLEARPEPFVSWRDEALDDQRALFDAFGVDRCFVAPIVHRGRLLGFVTTSTAQPVTPARSDWILGHLGAVSHLASAAIGNAMLIEEIRHQAGHDALTGLPNRTHCEDRARRGLSVAAREGTRFAYVFVDLDRFKRINDTLGHAVGDDLLVQVAERLRSVVGPQDVVTRLGGDEFLVMVPGLPGVAAAERIASQILRGLREPYPVAGESMFTTASVGVACYPDHGRDHGTLLARADRAMYAAKGRGRNMVAVHEQSVRTGAHSELQLENDLHRAVARDELRLHLQPQVDLRTGALVGAEALVRWQHPQLGLLTPAAFLDLAEESGVVVDIDRWVRHHATRHAAAWYRAGTPLRVAVNLSGRDLRSTTLIHHIELDLARHGLPAELLELEVTDRVVMSDEELPPSLAELREIGVRLAVDDFGTGTSVLSRLHRSPVDVLKVDRTFVEPLRESGADARLVDALLSMARALQLEVVVEGIETEQQAHALRMLGAQVGQGFLYHRPMPPEELAALLEPVESVASTA